MRRAVMVGWLVWCAAVTHDQVGVWRSDLTLWLHAATVAPAKPRPALNYGSALAIRGEFVGAALWWEHAIRLADAPHVPPHDRRRTLASARHNLSALR
jgi:hypothetical protein